MNAKIDRELSPHILNAVPPDTVLDAYVQIRPAKGPQSPEEREAQARQVLKRIEKLTNTKAKYHYLDLLDSMHVSAGPRFLARLLDQPEVVAAKTAPDSTESAFIKPKNPRAVGIESVNVPIRKHYSR